MPWGARKGGRDNIKNKQDMPSGGKREKAGRPKQASTRVPLSVRVEPSTKEQLRRHGLEVGPLLDKLARELFAEE